MSSTQQEYIQANYKRMQVKEMAANLKVSNIYITAWLMELNLTKERKSRRKIESETKPGYFEHDKDLATI